MELSTVLSSGSHKYLGFARSKLKYHEGPFIYSTNIIIKNRCQRDIICILEAWSKLRREQGLESNMIKHANFGGVTSALHILSYKHVDPSVFTPPPGSSACTCPHYQRCIARCSQGNQQTATSQRQCPLYTYQGGGDPTSERIVGCVWCSQHANSMPLRVQIGGMGPAPTVSKRGSARF